MPGAVIEDREWDDVREEAARLLGVIRQVTAVNVNRRPHKDAARDLARKLLGELLPALREIGLDADRIDQLKTDAEALLRLAGGNNAKSSYTSILTSITRTLDGLDAERCTRIGALANRSVNKPARSRIEEGILTALSELVPSAALSYEQALRDLNDPDRVSFRGTANELRETLRDVLSTLAPDDDVEAEDGFKYEKDQSKPSMKQKVRFILRARGVPKKAQKTTEASAAVVEELVGGLARAFYDRASLSAHTKQTYDEVARAKAYLDPLLAEILEVPAQTA